MNESASRRTFLKTAGAVAAAMALPARGQEAPAASAPHIVAGPYLQNVSPEAATVMWITDKPCVSRVDYGPTRELGNRVQNSHHGLVDAHDLVHRMHLTGLTPGHPCYYRVGSREITLFEPYKVEFGEQVEDAVRQFTPPLPGAGRVDFAVFNDLHETAETWARVHELAGQAPYDFLVFNGDLLNHAENHEQVTRRFLAPATAPMEGARPFVFVRGNHEARGVYARHLLDYFDTPNGGYYYAFTWGPVHFLVVDTGEDKLDESKEYFGLTNFQPYLEKEAAWVAEQVQSDAFQEAAFRVLLCHIPLRTSRPNDYRLPIIEALNGTGIDLSISAHMHKPAYHEPEPGRDFPIVIGGAPKPAEATVIRVEAEPTEMRMQMTLADGTLLESRNYSARRS